MAVKISIQKVHANTVEAISKMFFRQSFLKDYTTCPKMAYYKWVQESDQESSSFFAAHMGTAGHEVIFHMHENRVFDYDTFSLLEMLEVAFNKSINAPGPPIAIGKNYSSVKEQFDDIAMEYVSFLEGYQAHPHNQTFVSTIHEQPFVLEVIDKTLAADPSTEAQSRYLFTGTIDQGGYYEDGVFALRDIKFRDNAFRPSFAEFNLDKQMTIYAAALAFGKPSCDACRPSYVTHPETLETDVVYNGPCEKCSKIIGTPRWPTKIPERCELIWMRDFERIDKDQYEQYVIDNTQEKVANPKGKGPKVFPRVLNPKWVDGKKKGDYKGKCFLVTYRPAPRLSALLSDVIMICNSIRKGEFYRTPGEQCANFCRFADQCMTELKIEEVGTEKISHAAFTDNTF